MFQKSKIAKKIKEKVSGNIFKKREMCEVVSEGCAFQWDGSVCARVCARACMCVHTCTRVYLCVSVERLLGEKHRGVVGRADKLQHKTANSKERGIL